MTSSIELVNAAQGRQDDRERYLQGVDVLQLGQCICRRDLQACCKGLLQRGLQNSACAPRDVLQTRTAG